MAKAMKKAKCAAKGGVVNVKKQSTVGASVKTTPPKRK